MCPLRPTKKGDSLIQRNMVWSRGEKIASFEGTGKCGNAGELGAGQAAKEACSGGAVALGQGDTAAE